MKLYTYWRSSAAYRVRIALNLKRIEHELISVHLAKGAHNEKSYKDLNPQGLVPTLEYEGKYIGQSLAIMEFLDEIHPEKLLLPGDAQTRAGIRAMSQVVACDTHPLNNLRVLKYLSRTLELDEEARNDWYGHWIAAGFAAYESLIDPGRGRFSAGDAPTLADACLLPQIYNARRFNCDLTPYPKIRAVEQSCEEIPAFQDAHPDNQPDRD